MFSPRRTLCLALVAFIAATISPVPAHSAEKKRSPLTIKRQAADALEAAGKHDEAADAYGKLGEEYLAKGNALTEEAEAYKAAGRTAEANAKSAEAKANYSAGSAASELAASILLKQLDGPTPAAKPPAPAAPAPAAPTSFFPPGIAKPANPNAATTPPANTTPANTTPTESKTTFSVGDKIQYRLGQTWFDVTLTKIDGDKYTVHNEGRTKSKYETWDRVASLSELRAPPAAAAPVAGQHPLDGIYLQINQSFYNGSLSINLAHYWFRPDGNVYFGLPPGGLSQPDAFTALLKRDPRSCGTYGIVGDKINFQRPGEKPEQYTFGNENNGAVISWSGPSANRAGAFKDNQTLNASYSGGASAVGVSSTVSNAVGLDLHADGSYESSSVASVDSTGQRVNAGGGSQTSSRGKYSLSGNTLTLTDTNGKPLTLTVYPKPDSDESPPKHLCVDGSMYVLNGTK